MIKFKIERDFLQEDGALVTKGCTSIAFRNKSDNIVYINGEELGAGESMADNGEPLELNETQYKIKFDAACLTKKLYVRRKIYIK